MKRRGCQCSDPRPGSLPAVVRYSALPYVLGGKPSVHTRRSRVIHSNAGSGGAGYSSEAGTGMEKRGNSASYNPKRTHTRHVPGWAVWQGGLGAARAADSEGIEPAREGLE